MTGETVEREDGDGVDSSRAVFTFEYEGRTVSRDPSRVYRAIADDPDVDVIGELQDLSIEGIEAMGVDEPMQKILGVVDRAFGVKPLNDDGSGMTEAERIELVGRFLVYVQTVKKKLLVWPTRWQRTASAGSSNPSPPKPDSASSFTSTESTSDEASKSSAE